MTVKRALATFVAALTLLCSWGPEAWAQAVQAGIGAQGAAAPVTPFVAPVSPAAQASGGFNTSFSPLSPGLAPVVSVLTAPVEATRASAAALPAAAPGLARTPDRGATAARGADAASLAARTPARRQAIGPAARAEGRPSASPLRQRTAALSEQAAPLLDSIGFSKASPDSLRGGGLALQSLLEGSRIARSDPEGLAPSAAAPAAPERGGLQAVQKAAAVEPAATPAPELAPRQKSAFRFYSAGVAAVKVGIETLNLAVPMLLLTTLHAAAAVSTLYLAAECASLFAGLLGGALVDRLGPGKTMVLTAFAQMAAVAAVPLVLAAGGAVAMPAVYGLFVLNGIAGELFEIGRRSAMPQIVGRDEGLLRKYNGSLYVWREASATAGVFAAGWFLHTFGAMATIWAHPIFCLAAGFALLKLWKTGGRLEPTMAAQASGKQASEKQSLAMKARSWFADVVNGAKIVVFNKKLRTIVLVNIPLNAVHKIFHTLVAVIYASKMLGNPALAAVLLGAWNLGELAGAWYLERRGPESRISSWLRFAAGASLSTWLLWLLPTPFVAVPVSFLMAAAMIGNELGIASYMQASVPQHELGSVNGFVYAFSRAVGMLALFGAGLMFDALSPSGAFLALAVLFTLAAPIYFFASRSFRHDTMPGDIVPMDD